MNAIQNQALPEAILAAGADGHIVAASRACGKMFGMTEQDLLGQSVRRLLAEDTGQPQREELQALKPTESLQREVIARRADGTTFLCQLTAVRTQDGNAPLLFILRNITQSRELQDRMRQQEKLSALSRFISHLAHELSNPLTSVLGFSQVLVGHPDCPDKIRRDLRTILEQAQRCEKIVHNLLSFGCENKPEKTWIGINGVLESAVALLGDELQAAGIEVVKEFEQNLPKTMADYRQMERVFLNLITNAHQAMVMAKKGSRLLLRTSSLDGRVRVEIIDDGPGIPQEVLPRVLDPFFTTKAKGLATGLGLSICYGIVNEHGGRIDVQSQEGEGATFIIELPLRRPETCIEEKPAPLELEPPRPERRNLLVVDDEQPIIDLLFKVLSAEGHRVDTARDGAVSLRKMGTETYDLLITDIKMPVCDGQRLYERWQSLYPERARSALIITGDFANPKTREFLEHSGLRHIKKPFDLNQLLQTVRNMLNEIPPSRQSTFSNRL
ncbi:MAG: ATP-binding protein [Acidobacteriota bacterium]